MEHPNRDVLYLAYYWPWTKMINEYGPGVENVRSKLNPPKYERATEIWNEAFEQAVTKYLKDNNLVPEECTAGIIVVSSGQDVGGGGTTAFRCK